MVNILNSISNYDIKQNTTLKIGGNALLAYLPVTVGDMVDCVEHHTKQNNEINIIGAGSNLLVASKGIDGVTILTKNLKDVIQIEDDKIYALCGAKSSAFAKIAFEASLSGAEFLVGIPGSIGGAIFMNAGAHGQSIKDIIESVKILNLKSYSITEVPVKYLQFRYRSTSFFDKENLILSAIFKLQKSEQNEIKERMDFHLNYRAQNHPPLSEYSAGSTFKNPKGHYAANLLEKVGAKEYIENNKIRFSPKHANFLYNFNDADSTDAVRLMYNMWEKVKKEFGIKLQPEIKFIGKKTEEEEKLWSIMTKH